VPHCEEGALLGQKGFKQGCCRPGQCSIFVDEESEWAVGVGEGANLICSFSGANTCIQGHLLSQSVTCVIVEESDFSWNWLMCNSTWRLHRAKISWDLNDDLWSWSVVIVNYGKERHPEGLPTEVYIEAASMDEPTVTSKWDDECRFMTFWCGRVDGSRYMINGSLLLLSRW